MAADSYWNTHVWKEEEQIEKKTKKWKWEKGDDIKREEESHLTGYI